ncbi:unnamed protein product [Arabidopsis arenosa]|nr:unnamed protein product [Arabidopsis arenosa]
MRLLERLPERVPAQAPGVPLVAEVQPRIAVAEALPSYIKMMEQMQRIGTEFFSGGAKPKAADEWRMRMERNFLVELVETAALLEEGLKDEAVVTSPTLQAKKPHQQSSSNKSGKPVQGQKRKYDETQRASQDDTRVCFHCKEAGHIKPKSLKLQQREVAVVATATAIPTERQIATAPRMYSIGECRVKILSMRKLCMDEKQL